MKIFSTVAFVLLLGVNIFLTGAVLFASFWCFESTTNWHWNCVAPMWGLALLLGAGVLRMILRRWFPNLPGG